MGVRKFFLPALLFLFAIISLVTLSSIVPQLLAKQIIAFCLAFLIFGVLSLLPFHFYRKLALPLYILLNIVLLVLLFYGKVTRGITAWISLPFDFHFQPSQFALPITALLLADLFPQEEKLTWKRFALLLFLLFLPTVLIILEPDFGTAVVLLMALAVFVFVQRLSWQKLSLLVAGAILLAGLLWVGVFEDYQKERILSFFQPTTTVLSQETSSEYNSRQALIAVGSGQIWGRGLGQGIQSHLRFLPERQTDFIFASFSEEWGFVGAALLLLLYCALLAFLFRQMLQRRNFAEKQFLLSTFLMFLAQITINVGMNLGIVPITGITLPFVSYGGSSLLSLFFLMGLVQSIVKERVTPEFLSFY